MNVGKRWNERVNAMTPNENKVSDRRRVRAWLLTEVTNYSKLVQGVARGSLHRLVRPRCV